MNDNKTESTCDTISNNNHNNSSKTSTRVGASSASKGVVKAIGAQEWYNDEHIAELLRIKLKIEIEREEVVVAPIAELDRAELPIEIIKRTIEGIRSGLTKSVVIPMHMNGNHWVGMAIRLKKGIDGNNVLELMYNDPRGIEIQRVNNSQVNNNIAYIIQQITELATSSSLEINIMDFHIKQQSNDYDCGPLTVENLVRLARGASDVINYMSITGGNAAALRAEHNNTLLGIHANDIHAVNILYTPHLESDQDDSIQALTCKIQEARNLAEQIIAQNMEYIKKIARLKEIEETKYKPLVRKLAFTKSFAELGVLAIVLEDLGDLTKQIGDYSIESYKELTLDSCLRAPELDFYGNGIIYEYLSEISPLKCYTDSAIFYQYVMSIIKGKTNPMLVGELYDKQLEKQVEKLYTKLGNIKEGILSLSKSTVVTSTGTLKNIKEEVEENKKILADLRDDSAEMLRIVDNYLALSKEANDTLEKQQYEDLYINETRKLFTSIALQMQTFLTKLYIESENEIGYPPCKYTVMGLGSMALKQMTPYSDLEFAILIEHEGKDKSDSEVIKRYFRNITHLVNFKIINLGETIIPTSRYDIDLSHLICRAVNLDLGGKTPLGRIERDKPYELIKTVEQMVRYVKDEGEKASHIDKNLPYILEKVCYIYGDKSLIKYYQRSVTEFLCKPNHQDQEGRLNCEIRALKVLQEGASEIDYLQKLSKPPKISNQGDLEKFRPQLTKASDLGKLFDVKQEIYRLPDRLLNSLGLYYRINSNGAFDILDKLFETKIINKAAQEHLGYIVAFAITLRLKTYLHYNKQNDIVGIFPNTTNSAGLTKNIFTFRPEELEDNGMLFKYYYTALALHAKLEEFVRVEQEIREHKNNFFINEILYDDSQQIRGIIYSKILKYTEAINAFKHALDVKPYSVMLLKMLSNVLNASEQYDDALDCYNRILELKQEDPDAMHDKALIDAYKGRHESALAMFQAAAEIHKATNKPNYLISLESVGISFANLRQPKKALECLLNIIKIKKSKENIDHIELATTIDNIGLIYSQLMDYSKAEICYKNAKDIREAHYGSVHYHMITSWFNLGTLYGKQHIKHDDALKALEEAVTIHQQIYANPTRKLAACYNHMGIIYNNNKDYNNALSALLKALEIKLKLYADNPKHPELAGTYCNIGNAYAGLEKNELALKNYEDAKVIIDNFSDHDFYKVIYTQLSGMLTKIGISNIQSKQYNNALSAFLKVLEIKLKLHADNPKHPEVAGTYCNIGNAYAGLEKNELALKNYEDAKVIIDNFSDHDFYKVIYTQLSGMLTKIGISNIQSEQYDNALSAFLKVLEVKLKLHADNPKHPELAGAHYNIGNAYAGLEKNELALKNYEDAKVIIQGCKCFVYYPQLYEMIYTAIKKVKGLYTVDYKGDIDTAHLLSQSQAYISAQSEKWKKPLDSLVAIKNLTAEIKPKIVEGFIGKCDITIDDQNSKKVIDHPNEDYQEEWTLLVNDEDEDPVASVGEVLWLFLDLD